MRIVYLTGAKRAGGWRGVVAITLGLALAAVLAVVAFTAFLVVLPFAAVGAWLAHRKIRKTLAEMEERRREAFANARPAPTDRTIIDAEYRVISRD